VPRKLFAFLVLLLGAVPFAYCVYVSFQLDSRLPAQPDPVAGRVYALYPNHSRRFATQGEVDRFHGITTAAFLGSLVTMVGMGILSRAGSAPTVALRRVALSGADFQEIHRALSPRRLATSVRSLFDPVRSHWRELVPFWLVPSYFAFMSNLGSRLFGEILTMGILVPVPIFWAFIRAGRLYARGTISVPHVIVWVLLVPFLVLLLLAHLLRLALASRSGLSSAHWPPPNGVGLLG
jgi:hypothetical protein